MSFSDASGLTAQSLGIDAQLISILDPAILLRMPTSLLTSIPAATPMLVTIEPPANGGFSLNDTVRVELHTHLLSYTPGSRYRLFKAPLGGTFYDITDEVAPGSVRTRGTTGGFSQFLILVDQRSPATVVEEKLRRLESWLPQVPLSHRATLSAQVGDIRAAIAAGSLDQAIALTDAFRANVSELSGPVLPNTWKADHSTQNVGGELNAGAATLRFSIGTLRGN